MKIYGVPLVDNRRRFPIGDVVLEFIDEEDYYGCNFAKEQKVMQLFFTGSSDFFPCFWTKNGDYET